MGVKSVKRMPSPFTKMAQSTYKPRGTHTKEVQGITAPVTKLRTVVLIITIFREI